MSGAGTRSGSVFGAGAARAALALLCVLVCGAAAQDGAPPEDDGVTVGAVLAPAGDSALRGRLLPLLGRVVAWAGAGTDWRGFGETLAGAGGGEDLAWALALGTEGLRPEVREKAEPVAGQRVAFDISLDCNAFRAASPQPFSRTARGRALDALSIDNARRARLTGVYADPGDEETVTLVLFAESRAQAPGRWNARPLATITPAPLRGEDPRGAVPVQVDFGERWPGVVFAAADLALGLDAGSDTISGAERLEGFGLSRVGALRQLAAGLGGRVWLWAGRGERAAVCGLPLARGETDRRVAESLRAIFGSRLSWARDGSGRTTATLALGAEGPRLFLRFITIADRPALVVATEASDLDDAAETLADIDR